MFKRFLFDIETDGLLDTCTRVWIMYMTCLDTGASEEFLEGNLKWKERFDNAEKKLLGIISGFDLEALKKIHNYYLPDTVKVTDTLILSEVLNYRRFEDRGHSLEEWGIFLGVPKVVHEDWSQYSPEMQHRCHSDVALNLKVYDILKKELEWLKPKAPNILRYLNAETFVAEWCASAEREGWPFNLTAAKELKAILQAKLDEAYAALNAKLGTKTVPIDMVKGIVEYKTPRWTKQGCYDQHTANYFDVDPWSGFEGEERIVEGPYCRVSFEPLNLNSPADVKVFLYRNNWQPLEWNYTKDKLTGKKVQSSPKITEESLEFLGNDGKIYADFAVAKSRLGVLKTWIEKAEIDGRVHGECMTIGTPSMRARHNIIVNVPTPEKPYGKEMRALFITQPGWKLIGCDSAGNQARGLAHFLGNQKYIDTLINGDIHTANAEILTAVLIQMGFDWDGYLRGQGVAEEEIPKRKRGASKRILYAFLFGASGPKLWLYIFGVLNEPNGRKLKAGFTKAVPGFKELLDKLENIYGKTSQYSEQGYIPGIAGNRIYVDSFHKLLVYLLQATEKATCACSLMLAVKRLREAKIPYKPCVFMHDEIQFQVPEEYAEQAKSIGIQAFKDGPKLMGIMIMDGSGKIGDNWDETH